MMKTIDYDFSKFPHAKTSQVGCCARSAFIDNETRKFIDKHPNGVVIQIGASLDARYERLQKPRIGAWYDLDLPEAINARRLLPPENGNHYLSCSLFDPAELQIVTDHRSASSPKAC